MKLKSWLLLIGLMFIPLLGFAKSKTKTIKPLKNSKSVKLLINEKENKYYKILDKPVVLSIDGPGELKIITRCGFKDSDANSYSIHYQIDGRKKKTLNFRNKKLNEKVKLLGNNEMKITNSSTSKIKLGSGYHTLEFKKSGKSNEVYAKFIFKPLKSKKQKWVEFSPKSKLELVELIVDEDPIDYFRFSKESPLNVTVIGPADLKVFTRTENNYEMKGRINYRVQVKMDGKLMNTYMISSEGSTTAVYKDNDALVPGKARDFIIKVPKGKHTFEIVPLDKDKKTLLGKMLLPQKDTKLNEK